LEDTGAEVRVDVWNVDGAEEDAFFELTGCDELGFWLDGLADEDGPDEAGLETEAGADEAGLEIEAGEDEAGLENGALGETTEALDEGTGMLEGAFETGAEDEGAAELGCGALLSVYL
jgi:hypothetical protein